VATVAGVIGYCVGIWAPQSRQIKQVQSELEEYLGKVEKGKRQAARLTRLQEELKTLYLHAADLEKRLPKGSPSPGDIDSFESLASKDGVTVTDIATLKPRRTQYYIENGFEVTASASYRSFRRFLADIALEERLMEVREFRLAPQGRGSAQAVFKLVLYQYKG